jgi:hypothetical protein
MAEFRKKQVRLDSHEATLKKLATATGISEVGGGDLLSESYPRTNAILSSITYLPARMIR